MKRLNDILKSIFFLLTPSSSENLKVVLLSVLAATTFWFFTALNKTYTTRINYPVQFDFEKEDLIVVRELPENILVDVSGGGWNLLRRTVWWNIAPVNVPLENPTYVRYIKGAALYPEIADHLKDLKLNYVATDTLYFDIQKNISRRLKLEVNDSSILLEDGFRITSDITLGQDCVTVLGPEKLLLNLPNTLEVSLNKKSINRSYSEKIKIPSFDNKLIKLGSTEVEVAFEVSRFVDKQIELEVKKVGFSAEQAKLIPDKAIVLITIQENLWKDWPLEEFEVTAYKKNLNRSDSTILLSLTKFPLEINEIKLQEPRTKLRYE